MSLTFSTRNTKLLCVLILVIIAGCHKKRPEQGNQHGTFQLTTHNKITFTIENDTPQKLYAVCFYYAKRKSSHRWTWYKTKNVAILPPGKSAPLSIPIITKPEDLHHVHGYLALFTNEVDAQASIFELLSDKQKLDIGLIEKLHNKNVLLESTQYGFKGEQIEYGITDGKEQTQSELDFIVENQSGKDLYMNAFIYQHHGAHPQWDFEKLPTRFVHHGSQTIFDVDTVVKKYDWSNVRGYIGIFGKNELKKAKAATYESLNPSQKINVGRLEKIRGKKVVIVPKTYGVLGGFDARHPDVEFSIKPRYPFPENL